jgi:hypothetical protein
VRLREKGKIVRRMRKEREDDEDEDSFDGTFLPSISNECRSSFAFWKLLIRSKVLVSKD